MQANEYQTMAMRTNDGKASDRLLAALSASIQTDYVDGKKTQTVAPDIGGLFNGCLGLAGEAGETLDMVKKWVFHQKELDVEHFEKELGDVMWYMAMICHSMGLSLEEIMQKNIEKLKARYPEGFNIERANNRSADDV